MANLNEPTTQRPRSAEHDRARDESRSDRTTSGAPSQSYVEFRDDATERGSGATQQSHGRGTQTSEALPAEHRFRADLHGGEPTGEADDYGQSYRGRMRRYRHVNGRWVAERGPHTGRGPRDYRRSDERIREDVCDFLTDDAFLDASEVEVEVQDGEVTLAGTVHSRAEKREAGRLAEQIVGVQDVHNQLRIVPRET